MADRVVRDEIHRDILIPSSIGTLIDTKEFQRLRNVLQLSTCYYVFPSATHTRFSHSLGAYHLAKTLCDSLKEYQPDIFHEGDDELVAIAALLHDIAHAWRARQSTDSSTPSLAELRQRRLQRFSGDS